MKDDYADGMDDLPDRELRGATFDFVLVLVGSVLLLWALGIAVEHGLK